MGSRCLNAITVFVIIPLAAAAFSSSALGSGAAPGWTIESFPTPTVFNASNNGQCESESSSGVYAFRYCNSYNVTMRNAGSVAADGSQVVLTDTLPEGVTVQNVALLISSFEKGRVNLSSLLCSGSNPVRCEYPGVFAGILAPLATNDTMELHIGTTVNNPTHVGLLTNTANVSGGGAPEAVTSTQNRVGEGDAGFGTSSVNFFIDSLDGTHDTRAGGHPYELTTTIGINNTFRTAAGGRHIDTSAEDIKDIVADLPVGFVGSTLSAPECTFVQLSSKVEEGRGGCPSDTVIGHLWTAPSGEATAIDSDIYNMVPERGVPAEFAYVDGLAGPHVFYVHVVPTPDGYVLQTINPDIPQIPLNHIVVTFYGDPALHDQTGNTQIPYFTNPTSCANGPLVTTLYMDSWSKPGSYNADGTPNLNDPAWVTSGEDGRSVSPPVTGCNALTFTPELGSQPTTHMADTPSGLEFEMRLPQHEEMATTATPALKKVVVRLPEGFTVDPSAGDGLGACSEAQIGWLGGTTRNFAPTPPQCPENSKIGSLELSTPLLPQKLSGELFLARQSENPFNTLLAAYVVVDDPITGVLIKIAGEFLPDPNTGRLTAVFDENPQLPFDDLKLHFFSGPRSELATPQTCGLFATESELTPWSAPDSGPVATPSDSFLIDEMCEKTFAPTVVAGSTNLQAAAHTAFEASFSRSDTDQELAGLTITLPPGLLGDLKGIPLCSDADANAGTCSDASEVGTVLTGVGPGPNPLFVEGKMFLTGPYKGGPYGLAVVVPAVAGPFNFGTVVVRQSLHIDPLTAQVADISDPFPRIIDGIPLRIRRVDVRVERPGFIFNPSNCQKLGFSGTVTGTQGATSPVAAAFQVTNCATLGFKPGFKVSTNGKTSRRLGASLNVKLSYPQAPFGTQANIKSVKVDLPKQLPSNLKTLQQACPSQVFQANPAGCPSGSKVGTASASTPILATTLTGPAYFVSYGGAKFPELVIVLQGENGISVQLHGETFINPKTNITSSTFRAVPDVPVDTFTLSLPQGSNSALDANTNLCSVKGGLRMPTSFTAQNGAVVKQVTQLAVSNCSKRTLKGAGKAKKKAKPPSRTRHARHAKRG
jgi:uncharacterized repeat protein (TIGR01451 family)